MGTAIECRALQRHYGDVSVLRDVDFALAPGDYAAIGGVSGSGKSTMLNILGLLDRPTAGSYHLFGHDTAGWDERRRAQIRSNVFGFVFQSFFLVPERSVFDNVALGLLYCGVPRVEWPRRVEQAARFVGVEHRLSALAGTLSGGEQQRAALARAMVSEPAILLCDEPTGNLDSGNTANVLALLRRMSDRGMTLIVVTHDPVVSAEAAQLYTMTDGVLAKR